MCNVRITDIPTDVKQLWPRRDRDPQRRTMVTNAGRENVVDGFSWKQEGEHEAAPTTVVLDFMAKIKVESDADFVYQKLLKQARDGTMRSIR